MRVDTLQLVHDGTDVLYALSQFYLHRLFNDAHQRMAVHHGTEVVHSIGQRQGLRIGVRLAHLLHSTVDISQMRINSLHGFTVQHTLQAKYAVRTGVLRTNVDNEIVVCKQRNASLYQVTVLVERILERVIQLHILFQSVLVVLGRDIEVLTKWIAFEIIAQIKTAHILVTQELNT